MTTIAYHHDSRTIAVDGRMSSGSSIVSDNYKKWYKNGDLLYFMAGDSSEIPLFIAEFNWGEESKANYGCRGFLVENGEAFEVEQNAGIFTKVKLFCNDAVGSGGCYAISAMDFGKDAKGAVEYAATRDLYTGGSPFVYDIAKAEFI